MVAQTEEGELVTMRSTASVHSSICYIYIYIYICSRLKNVDSTVVQAMSNARERLISFCSSLGFINDCFIMGIPFENEWQGSTNIH